MNKKGIYMKNATIKILIFTCALVTLHAPLLEAKGGRAAGGKGGKGGGGGAKLAAVARSAGQALLSGIGNMESGLAQTESVGELVLDCETAKYGVLLRESANPNRSDLPDARADADTACQNADAMVIGYKQNRKIQRLKEEKKRWKK